MELGSVADHLARPMERAALVARMSISADLDESLESTPVRKP
jgi:hypothetical protein